MAQAAELIVLVDRRPKDKQALLERFGVTEKTHRRWVKRAGADPALAELVRKRTEEVDPDWADLAEGTMRDVLEAMAETARRIQAKLHVEHGDLRELAGAAKIVGELLTARGVLNVGNTRPPRKDPAVPAAGGGVRPGADSASPPVH